jgi:hypothetical protein
MLVRFPPSSLLLLALAHIGLLATQRLYPFVDMPNHLAQATIVRYLHDPATVFAQFFTVDLFPRPNVLHLLWCAAPWWSGVEAANRAFWGLYAAGTLAAAGWLCRRAGGSAWCALLAAPVLYPVSVAWGFVGFAAATPLLLLWLAEAPLYLQQPTRGRGCVLAVLGLLLFLAHALAALFALGLYAVLWGVQAWRDGRAAESVWRRGAATLGPLVPVAVLLAAWQAAEARAGGHAGHLWFLPYYYRTQYVASLGKRAAAWTADLDWLGPQGVALAWAYGVFLLGALGFGLARARRDGWGGASKARVLTAALPALAAFGAVWLLPERLPGYHLLFQRFTAWAWLGLVPVVALLWGARPPRWLCLAALALACAHFALAARHFRGFDRAAADLTPALLPEVSAEAVLAGAIFAPYHGRHAVYLHAADYRIVWQRGLATTRFIDARSFPVQRRAGTEAALPPFEEWMDHWASSADFDPHRYDAATHVLVRGEPAGRAGALLAGRDVVRAAGTWRIYGPRRGLPE